jgi:hypothetical protein
MHALNELAQQPSESPLSWLARLRRADTGDLSLAQRRARACYLADARRLLQEEQQRARWGRTNK